MQVTKLSSQLEALEAQRSDFVKARALLEHEQAKAVAVAHGRKPHSKSVATGTEQLSKWADRIPVVEAASHPPPRAPADVDRSRGLSPSGPLSDHRRRASEAARAAERASERAATERAEAAARAAERAEARLTSPRVTAVDLSGQPLGTALGASVAAAAVAAYAAKQRGVDAHHGATARQHDVLTAHHRAALVNEQVCRVAAPRQSDRGRSRVTPAHSGRLSSDTCSLRPLSSDICSLRPSLV